LLEFVSLIHDAFNPNLSSVKVADGGREHVGLGEGANDGDFISKNLAWGPRDTGCVAVDAIDDKLTTAADVMDGVLEDLGGTGSLHITH